MNKFLGIIFLLKYQNSAAVIFLIVTAFFDSDNSKVEKKISLVNMIAV